MTLEKVRIKITADDDRNFEGYTVEAFNTVTKAKRTYRADFVKSKPTGFVWYRLDQKPTTRTHEWVDLGQNVDDISVFDTWVDEQAVNLAHGVM